MGTPVRQSRNLHQRPTQRRESCEGSGRLEAQDAGGERGLGLGPGHRRAHRAAPRPTASACAPGRRGSVSPITVAAGGRPAIAPAARPEIRASSDRRQRRHVALLSTTSRAVLAGMGGAARQLGLRVIGVPDREAALQAVRQHESARAAADGYHLDGSVTAIEWRKNCASSGAATSGNWSFTADHTQQAREAPRRGLHTAAQADQSPLRCVPDGAPAVGARTCGVR